MRFLLFGILGLLILLLFGYVFLKADPKVLARRVRPVGPVMALTLAFVFAATGRLDLAGRILRFAFGSPAGTYGAGTGPAPGGRRPGTSRVRTAMLEMELDHASGEMHGMVLAGRYTGRSLRDLGPADLAALLAECSANDGQSEAVLVAWLDRYHPDWRTDSHFAAGAGAGSGEGSRSSAAMSREEACEVLGVEPGASEEEIRRAHKRMMKRFHPDHGGSDYLAAKINEAKNVLLGK